MNKIYCVLKVLKALSQTTIGLNFLSVSEVVKINNKVSINVSRLVDYMLERELIYKEGNVYKIDFLGRYWLEKFQNFR